MYDFANLLFSGPCNARCTFCIGQQIESELQPNNLNTYPPQNLDTFLALIRKHDIRQVVFSGSNTDPQLYRYQERLLAYLRKELAPEVMISLHTNGLQALRRMSVFNLYDRAVISVPSFQHRTYQQMMGRHQPPDLKAILKISDIPVKVSCVISRENLDEIPAFTSYCARMGVHRLVLRKLFAETKNWDELLPGLITDPRFTHHGSYRDNPVYIFEGMEVTLWDFNHTSSHSLNLFSSGWISDRYLLQEANAPRSSSIKNPTGSGLSAQAFSATGTNSGAFVSR